MASEAPRATSIFAYHATSRRYLCLRNGKGRRRRGNVLDKKLLVVALCDLQMEDLVDSSVKTRVTGHNEVRLGVVVHEAVFGSFGWA